MKETSKKPPKGEGKPKPFKSVGEAGWEKGFVLRVMGRVQRVLRAWRGRSAGVNPLGLVKK